VLDLGGNGKHKGTDFQGDHDITNLNVQAAAAGWATCFHASLRESIRRLIWCSMFICVSSWSFTESIDALDALVPPFALNAFLARSPFCPELIHPDIHPRSVFVPFLPS